MAEFGGVEGLRNRVPGHWDESMIHIRNSREIDLIRAACRIVVEALNLVEKMIEPGITTQELNQAAEKFILSRKGWPAFKGFEGYPAATCISVEDQVVHGIPGTRVLKEGEIVSVDIGVELNGYYGDSARTFMIGNVSEEKQRLMRATNESLYLGIERAIESNRIHDISFAIQNHVERNGFSVVRDLVGHGIGRELHEPPRMPNYGKPHTGPRLRAGMVLAIEPMVNMGKWEVVTEPDNWTVVTADGLPSAHFEHTITITKGEPEILTINESI